LRSDLPVSSFLIKGAKKKKLKIDRRGVGVKTRRRKWLLTHRIPTIFLVYVEEDVNVTH